MQDQCQLKTRQNQTLLAEQSRAYPHNFCINSVPASFLFVPMRPPNPVPHDYGRAAAIASTMSATASTLASGRIASPFSPVDSPIPSSFS